MVSNLCAWEGHGHPRKQINGPLNKSIQNSRLKLSFFDTLLGYLVLLRNTNITMKIGGKKRKGQPEQGGWIKL